MAQKVQILLIDDVDGTEAAETVSFGLDGVDYEIDLSEKNAAELRAAIHPFMEKARRLKQQRGDQEKKTINRGRNTEIRNWAKSQGIAVNDRGRLPSEVVAKYEAAHS